MSTSTCAAHSALRAGLTCVELGAVRGYVVLLDNAPRDLLVPLGWFIRFDYSLPASFE